MTTKTDWMSALDLICNVTEDELVDLDRRIEKLSTTLDRMRRLRKMLDPGNINRQLGGRPNAELSADLLPRIEQVVLASSVPLRASEIGEKLKEPNYMMIGKVACLSEKIKRLSDGRFEKA